MNIFGVGLPEMAIILMVALLVFGPKKLPEISKSLGKALRGFQDASKEFENQFKQEAEQIEQAVSLTASAAEVAAVQKPVVEEVEEVQALEEVKAVIEESSVDQPSTDEQAKSIDSPEAEVSSDHNPD